MDYELFQQLCRDVDILRRIAETYGGRSVENIIMNYEARIQHHIKQHPEWAHIYKQQEQ